MKIKLPIKLALIALSLTTALTTAPTALAQSTCSDLFSGQGHGQLSGPQSDSTSTTAQAVTELKRETGTPSRAPVRQLNAISEFVFMQYNVENLFLRVGKYDRGQGNQLQQVSDIEVKSPEALKGVATAILDSNPDFVTLEEVESQASLEEFNKTYLNSKYKAILIDGNDERGINIGFLVKNDLPISFLIESHKNTTWTDPTDGQVHPLFSRDFPALIVSRADTNSKQPLFILLGNHAKSMRDRPGDPKSNILRAAQYKGMGVIIDQYRARFGQNVPLMLAGDFNTEVRKGMAGSEAVAPIHSRMTDAFDAVGAQGLSRMTHTFHPRGDTRSFYHQLDALFVTPSLAKAIVSATTYRYKDAQGNPKPMPRSYEERSLNPSDHFPIVVKIKADSILK